MRPTGSKIPIRHRNQSFCVWGAEDLRQLDLAGCQILLQLRSRRADLVRLLKGTQALFPRSARNARSCLAARHAAILDD